MKNPVEWLIRRDSFNRLGREEPDVSGRRMGRLLGVAGAAVLGTLAGAHAAHAVIGVDGQGQTTGALIYAKETLRSDETIKKGDETYYVVSEGTRLAEGNDGVLDIRIDFGVARAAGTQTVVTLDLHDMVIAQNIVASNQARVESSPGAIVAGVDEGLLSGGQTGDAQATFSIAVTGSTPIAANNGLYLSIRKVGILPDKAGSFTVTVSYSFAGQQIEHVTRIPNAVRAQNVLDVTVTPTSPTALVAERFRKFKPDDGENVRSDQLAANVGLIKLGHVTAPSGFAIRLQDGSPSTLAPSAVLAGGTEIVFDGETSFLGEDGAVYVSPSADCSPGSDTILDEDGSMKATVADVDFAGGYLCFEVDGETAIPETEPYTVRIDNAALANAAFPPAGADHTLGRIMRNGATVRIPYLTTNVNYNQRIVVVNRTGSPASYEMTFIPAEGTTATPGEMASGRLAVGRTILTAGDVVTLDAGSGNGGHTAAELMVVAPVSELDVATWSTNRRDGSTDTVVYTGRE